jgi:hypothetical protein
LSLYRFILRSPQVRDGNSCLIAAPSSARFARLTPRSASRQTSITYIICSFDVRPLAALRPQVHRRSQAGHETRCMHLPGCSRSRNSQRDAGAEEHSRQRRIHRVLWEPAVRCRTKGSYVRLGVKLRQGRSISKYYYIIIGGEGGI